MVSCIEEVNGLMNKVRYSHLRMTAFRGRWGATRAIGWWVASEEGMMPCVRLRYSHTAFGYILCFWLHTLIRWGAIWHAYGYVLSPWFWLHPLFRWSNMGLGLVSCIWGMYSELRKALVLPPCFWLHPVEGEENHGMVSCIEEVKVLLHKVRYSHFAYHYISWKVRSNMGRSLVSCIWWRYGALRKA